MEETYEKIWELAKPYLKKGLMKDFIIHSEGVARAMRLLIAGEGGDERILIPAAMLHDVGFSKVAPELQTNADWEKKKEAQRQHLAFAKEIIEEILGKADYTSDEIAQVISIVQAHKFQEPEEKEKRMLIDADNLSDTFKEQFESDASSYGITLKENYEFRGKNQYYSETAKIVAQKELADRLADFQV